MDAPPAGAMRAGAAGTAPRGASDQYVSQVRDPMRVTVAREGAQGRISASSPSAACPCQWRSAAFGRRPALNRGGGVRFSGASAPFAG